MLSRPFSLLHSSGSFIAVVKVPGLADGRSEHLGPERLEEEEEESRLHYLCLGFQGLYTAASFWSLSS